MPRAIQKLVVQRSIPIALGLRSVSCLLKTAFTLILQNIASHNTAPATQQDTVTNTQAFLSNSPDECRNPKYARIKEQK